MHSKACKPVSQNVTPFVGKPARDAGKTSHARRSCDKRAKWSAGDYLIWGLCIVFTLAYCATVAWGMGWL